MIGFDNFKDDNRQLSTESCMLLLYNPLPLSRSASF